MIEHIEKQKNKRNGMNFIVYKDFIIEYFTFEGYWYTILGVNEKDYDNQEYRNYLLSISANINVERKTLDEALNQAKENIDNLSIDINKEISYLCIT